MESNLVLQDYEPTAKRLKTDSNETISGELCSNQRFSGFSATFPSPIDHGKDLATNCDASPNSVVSSTIIVSSDVESEEIPNNLTESLFTSPTHEITDTSQEEDEEEEEEEDDNASTVSHLSELSGISNFSGHEWKPRAGSMIWIQQKMQKGIKPRNILNDLGVEKIPQYVDDLTLWKVIINMLAEPPRRHKLRHVNTLDDVVRLLKGAHKIIVLTGAGVSVSCGIPDFRSKDGIYSRLAKEFPNLPNPQAMFDINYFSQDPRPFFKFAKDIYPGKFKPSPCHRFIRLLEKNRKLLRNYTQNIDTLEKEAGIERAIECHGSFATATCTKCEHKVSADKIRDTVLNQKIPMCEVCNKGNIEVSTDDLLSTSTNYKNLVLSGIMKPDIVFFGEGLPDTFHDAMASDKTECDLLLVIGSSLKVRPVALIPNSLPSPVPQILINREPLSHCHFDVELLGDCDVIINHLCRLLGENWEEGVSTGEELTETTELLQHNDKEPVRSFDFNKWRANFPVNLQECNCTVENNEIPSSSKQQEKICSCNHSLEEEEGTNKLKERHISIDSARDSGIGENSNFADLENDKEPTTFSLDQDSTSTESCSLKKIGIEEEKTEDLRGFWRPKVKKSLAERLPPKTFYLSPPSRYIFPGAEVYFDHDDKSSGLDDDDESSSDTVSECC